MLQVPTLREMLKVGMHFGHKKERSHPKAKEYIFGLKDKIYIIDLEKTKRKLAEALDWVGKSAAEGKIILFLGTKRQARKSIKTAAQKCGMPYVDFRWLGGVLTNFSTIQKSIKKLEKLEAEMASEEFKKLTKKERLLIEREIEKLGKTLAGFRHLKKIPDVLFIVDTTEEYTAVKEAKKMGVPVVGICDTTANPEFINKVIPANDDSEKAVEMIVNLMAEAVNEGKKGVKVEKSEIRNSKHETNPNDKNSKS